MATKILDKIWVCDTCLSAIANNDYTSLDYYFEPQKADIEQRKIETGIARLTDNYKNYLVAGNDENRIAFSSSKCDCCKCLPGSMNEIIILS